MMTAFAKGSTKRLDIIQAYKRLVTPLVGSSATEIQEALTTQWLNAIQPALYTFVRAGIREQVGSRVPERGRWSGLIVIQEVIGLSIFRQACFALVSPVLAADRGEYLHSRMKSMEVSCCVVASSPSLDSMFVFVFLVASRSTATSGPSSSPGKPRPKSDASKTATRSSTV